MLESAQKEIIAGYHNDETADCRKAISDLDKFTNAIQTPTKTPSATVQRSGVLVQQPATVRRTQVVTSQQPGRVVPNITPSLVRMIPGLPISRSGTPVLPQRALAGFRGQITNVNLATNQPRNLINVGTRPPRFIQQLNRRPQTMVFNPMTGRPMVVTPVNPCASVPPNPNQLQKYLCLISPSLRTPLATIAFTQQLQHSDVAEVFTLMNNQQKSYFWQILSEGQKAAMRTDTNVVVDEQKLIARVTPDSTDVIGGRQTTLTPGQIDNQILMIRRRGQRLQQDQLDFISNNAILTGIQLTPNQVAFIIENAKPNRNARLQELTQSQINAIIKSTFTRPAGPQGPITLNRDEVEVIMRSVRSKPELKLNALANDLIIKSVHRNKLSLSSADIDIITKNAIENKQDLTPEQISAIINMAARNKMDLSGTQIRAFIAMMPAPTPSGTGGGSGSRPGSNNVAPFGE